MAEPLTLYKWRKFQHDIDDADHQFRQISDGKTTLRPTRLAYMLFVYAIDNSMGDLFSMWEGIIEHLRLFLIKSGCGTDKEIRGLKENTKVLERLGAVAGYHGVVAQIKQLFDAEEINALRGARNAITHTDFAHSFHVEPGIYIDFLLHDPTSGRQFLFFRDVMPKGLKVKALYDRVCAKCPL